MLHICNIAIAPIYKDASDCSEMTTQMLFGEICDVLMINDTWAKVKLRLDNYEGWVNLNQIQAIDEVFAEKIKNQDATFLSNEPVSKIYSEKKSMLLPFACTLPLFNDKTFFIGNEEFYIEGDEEYKCHKKTPERISFFAQKYINSPYLWGGRSNFGIDCSGFVQNVFRICGFQLPRDVSQQKECGILIENFDDIQKNDLLFFSKFQNNEDTTNRIIHVGIYLSKSRIIHSHGSVRIDKIDENGIFDIEKEIYTHKFNFARRIIM
jgi:hypothetical protein